jgi:hypothetical protein
MTALNHLTSPVSVLTLLGTSTALLCSGDHCAKPPVHMFTRSRVNCLKPARIPRVEYEDEKAGWTHH